MSAFVALSVILKLADIRSLFAAVALYDFKADGIAVIQRFKTVDLNRGIMNENIFPFIGGNESVAFFCIKPFYFSCDHELSSYATIIKNPCGWTLTILPHVKL